MPLHIARQAIIGLLLLSLAACAAPESIAPVQPGGPNDPGGPSVIVIARSADSFVQSIGVNLHLNYFQTAYGTGWATIVKPRLLELGVRHVRDIGNVVTSDGWMQTVYGRMSELADSGIRFNLILRPAEGSTDYGSVNHLGRLIQYAAPSVESFEGLNEHDNSGRVNWIAELRSFQQAAYRALKADPRTAALPILGPSMAYPNHAPPVGDLSAFMDYGALHPYPGGERPLAMLETHESYGSEISGTHPFMATESGYHTATSSTGGHPPVSEEAMGRYVPRLFLDHFNAGIARTFLYELIDEGTDLTDREQAFGLLRADGSPKPAFTSLKNLIALLADPGPAFAGGSLAYELTGDTTDVRRLLLRKRNGRFYLVLWHDAVSYSLTTHTTASATARQVTLRLDRPAQIRSFTTQSTTTPLNTWSGASAASFTVPDSPLLLELSL